MTLTPEEEWEARELEEFEKLLNDKKYQFSPDLVSKAMEYMIGKHFYLERARRAREEDIGEGKCLKCGLYISHHVRL